MNYKEHYPDSTNVLDASDEAQGKQALCGQKSAIVLNLWRDNDLDEDVICKKCRNKACPDCFGTGIMGGRQTGIYCQCDYGTVAELRNGGGRRWARLERGFHVETHQESEN